MLGLSPNADGVNRPRSDRNMDANGQVEAMLRIADPDIAESEIQAGDITVSCDKIEVPVVRPHVENTDRCYKISNYSFGSSILSDNEREGVAASGNAKPSEVVPRSRFGIGDGNIVSYSRQPKQQQTGTVIAPTVAKSFNNSAGSRSRGQAIEDPGGSWRTGQSADNSGHEAVYTVRTRPTRRGARGLGHQQRRRHCRRQAEAQSSKFISKRLVEPMCGFRGGHGQGDDASRQFPGICR